MATIYERRKKIEKEQKRFVRKLRALQEECPHGDGFVDGRCPNCLKEEVHDASDTDAAA